MGRQRIQKLPNLGKAVVVRLDDDAQSLVALSVAFYRQHVGADQVAFVFTPHFSDATAEAAIKLLRRTGQYSVSKASMHETKQLARGWGGPQRAICLASAK